MRKKIVFALAAALCGMAGMELRHETPYPTHWSLPRAVLWYMGFFGGGAATVVSGAAIVASERRLSRWFLLLLLIPLPYELLIAQNMGSRTESFLKSWYQLFTD